MTQKECTIRIVIPCRNADRTIEACLAAACRAARAAASGAEVVIVDDGENTVLERMKNIYPCTILRTRGGVGAGAARNLGALGFAGRVLVFIDVDVELTDARALSALASPIEKGEAQATVGCYTGARRSNFSETYKHRYLAHTYGRRIGSLNNTFWTALCAVERESFETLGGYSESYAWAGPEDIDFGIELTKRGGRILAVPEAQGDHLASLDLKKLLANDLRKGTEDIYIHWMKKVALTDNRHVTLRDMAAVAVASLGAAMLCLLPVLGMTPFLVCAMIYLCIRSGFMRAAFGGEGLLFLLRAALLCFALDIVRALAVCSGTLLCAFVKVMERVKRLTARQKKITETQSEITI